MALVLTNTLSGKKEPFTPADPGHARIYVCGPTVYDYSHLGHARCYIVYDVLVRHLRASGTKVTYCRNVTDIDDKILNRAAEAGEEPTALAERFTTAFRTDMERLGNLPPDVEPKVTAHIPQIISMIASLVARGAAYTSGGDVYFDVKAVHGYGQLSHRPLDELRAGASGRVDEEAGARKKDPADFALWKSPGADDKGPTWPSPWGVGRPGWHVECSAMSKHHLGDTLDLHGGGLDLVFPHHENELAISETANGHPYVRHWVHNGFVEVDRQKMSKSLGNFFTARELFERVEPEAMRYYAMTVHYRSPMGLDWTLDEAGKVTGFPQIDEAERRVEYLYRTQLRIQGVPATRHDPKGRGEPDADVALDRAMAAALDDDLNMPVALAAIGDFLKRANELADASDRNQKVRADALEAVLRGFEGIRARLGLGTQDAAAVLQRVRDRRARAAGVEPSAVAAALQARLDARARKDFARADEIRAELTAKGVEVLDVAGASDWRMK